MAQQPVGAKENGPEFRVFVGATPCRTLMRTPVVKR
jgi:hypothetical protein